MEEIGMSGDRTAVPPLIVMAEAGEAQGRSPLLQLKAVESLGRLREPDAVPVLRGLLEAKKVWKWTHHKELRIAAAQAHRSEEHTSELQSQSNLVCRLLLEKKKQNAGESLALSRNLLSWSSCTRWPFLHL